MSPAPMRTGSPAGDADGATDADPDAPGEPDAPADPEGAPGLADAVGVEVAATLDVAAALDAPATLGSAPLPAGPRTTIAIPASRPSVATKTMATRTAWRSTERGGSGSSGALAVVTVAA